MKERSLNPSITERFLFLCVGRSFPGRYYATRPPLEIVAVALPLPVEQTFSYSVPSEWQDVVRVGSAVLVPFGRRSLTGIVIQDAATPASTPAATPSSTPAATPSSTPATELDPGGRPRRDEQSYALKPIEDVLDSEPAISAEQLALATWIADYYLCGIGEVLRAMLPPGIGSISEQRVRRRSAEIGYSNESVALANDLSDSDRQVLEYIPHSGAITVRALRRLTHAATTERLSRFVAKGLVDIESSIRGPRTAVRMETVVRLLTSATGEEPRGSKQIAILDVLRSDVRASDQNAGGGIPQGELLKQTGASTATLRRLNELGFVDLSQREIDRSRTAIADAEAAQKPPVHTLDPTQTESIQRLDKAIRAGQFEAFLLHGVTGSGKTEVYIEALKTARSLGKSGIILVPEISLTPQTVARFRSHFGDEIAVLHSRMSPGERYDAWRGIRSGTFPIVIGPRSAILAPLDNIGLIVVDEEHEQSYKQVDPAPRYHARDVAVFRAMQSNAACVLGSATPSLESLANAMNGKYALLTMPERIIVEGQRATLPKIRIVDMRGVKSPDGSPAIISEQLARAIESRLNSRQQVILLQNRRGYAPVVRCEKCNWTPECRDCSVTMTYHKSRRHLRCHYCGLTTKLPRTCPECGHDSLLQLGVGTQRVEEEILERFPEARVARMDLDTTTEKDAHHRILQRFARGKADILLGTQMVAKGLDFGNVSLVGIISADTGLSLPDIRSEERTFQLLTQVAGRAGRAELAGEVILQTYNPGHRVIQYAMRHDYDRFTREVMPERMALEYPPFGRLIALLFTGPEENRLNTLAMSWSRVVLRLDPTLTILGPSPSFIGRVRRNFRSQVLIKVEVGRSHRHVRSLIRESLAALGNLPRDYKLAVDIDPVGLA